jgi:hypothetical protein
MSSPVYEPQASASPSASPRETETSAYSAELLQRLVDQGAYFNLHSTPSVSESRVAIRGSGGKEILGLRVVESLRRFSIDTYPPTERQPFRATNTIGEIAGSFTHHWMFIPDDYLAQPGSEIPPTALDASRSQRFVMVDGICRFGNGADGFRGFGPTLRRSMDNRSYSLRPSVRSSRVLGSLRAITNVHTSIAANLTWSAVLPAA